MEIIKKNQRSASQSASVAIIDHLRDWYCGTKNVVSSGVFCESIRGVKLDCFISLPVTVDVKGNTRVMTEVLDTLGEDVVKLLNESIEELQSEKKAALSYLEKCPED